MLLGPLFLTNIADDKHQQYNEVVNVGIAFLAN